jgi:hypothetical protein
MVSDFGVRVYQLFRFAGEVGVRQADDKVDKDRPE